MDPVSAFDEPLKKLLGGATAKVMAEHLDLHTVGDLLHHYPRRYEERGRLTALTELPLDEHVTVVAQVADARIMMFNNGRGKRLEVTLTDGSGRLQLVFFGHGVHKPHKELLPGRRAMFAGKVSVFNRKMQLAHPTYQLLDARDDDAGDVTEAVDAFAGQLLPIYPACKQLDSWRIAKAVDTVLPSAQEAVDPLPPALREGRGFVPLPEALLRIHRPQTKADIAAARDRLRWDEAFVLQVALARRRYADTQLPAKARRSVPGGLLDAFDATLPFTLTEGQQKVTGEIFDALATEHPMHRLLQGEVGSGKTLVALRAMLRVVDAGGQAAMLAPTEVLAQQHHRSVTEMMGELAEKWGLWRDAPPQEGGGGRPEGMPGGSGLGTKVVLLTGSMGVAARRQALLDLVTGEAGIVIGTHALIEDKVQFHDLGLVVVDEQHRFGVEQRDALRSKGKQPPHLLVMTATPIPRTVAMTVFGDLETSVLDQLPAGRSPIASHVVPAKDKPHFLSRAWERVREEVENGHQAYVVCPRIGDEDEPAGRKTKKAAEEDGDKRPPLAVLEIAEQLAKGPLAGLRVEVLHGRMPADDKDDVMRRFAAGQADVLVATTVIEVGVNVPNATAMVIMDADRFGVSQLHQLRGRVGRGSAPGLCLLVSEAHEASPARARLSAVAATLDGFELSRIDLEQRREGDVLGQAQSGVRSSLRVLSVIDDEEVIAAAREEAVRVVADDPGLERLPELRTALDALLDKDREEYLDKG
ncbi:ATP-dependent DNA helicase RecG [Streptomyces sp. NPDC053741]|uniref:ATP-dependent DNA helicase RecG n=1 Tax=Streptomyces TaxID=1883 RepID=UPI000BDA166D|nr:MULTISPECIES: ATP-dependent DNA helicase RecG [unclassified Streptomyces]RAS25386.1 ATP-dependent DNA helicase RecG [Streptomyces avidinii]SNX80992.1 ATP-dependent DNA helicase RecG [Streptomyces microflavus]MDF6064933.1 ATP-dependent DNA helicase RecG [Streptomyces sp. JH010]MDX2619104.1 ATP-dependent DNA helicase RecG [Streptomyces sp. WI03-5b]MDX3182336.1 ATP-dependent DNA helicase RecG [Streptomyces sp. ME02-7008A-1]